jgi:cation transport ATPase
MDKMRLNEAELRKVIAFIESRGFHDPGVIVEILDHFACKIEEKMQMFPGTSLDEAMRAAHNDFGRLGFYPLMANYEANTRKKYKAVYRQQRNRVLTNPLYIVPVLILSVLFYYGYLWANVYAKWEGINLFSAIAYVGFLAAFIVLNLRFKLIRHKSKLINEILNMDLIIVCFLNIICIQEAPYKPAALVFYAVVCSINCLYILVRTAAIWATLTISQPETDMVYSYLKKQVG